MPAGEFFDEEKQEFVKLKKDQTLQLEHSLVSLSKWESKWCKPYLTKVVCNHYNGVAAVVKFFEKL